MPVVTVVLHLETRILWHVLIRCGTRRHGWRTIRSGQGRIVHHARLLQVLIVIGPVHIRVLRNALLARFSRDESTPHCASDDAGGDDENDGGQHNPAAPLHVRYEEKNVHEESEEGDEECRDGEDEQSEEVSR